MWILVCIPIIFSLLTIYLWNIFLIYFQWCYHTDSRLKIWSGQLSIPANVEESVACSEHYREFALSSIIGKVLDRIITQIYGHALSSSDLQFSFKERHSTVTCSAVIKEVTPHYIQNQIEVDACTFDATKPYDKVSFTKLFALLLKRDIPAIIPRVILDLYTRQSLTASWNGCTWNPPFSITNGVRQGRVLSQILFNVYMDELIDKLKGFIFVANLLEHSAMLIIWHYSLQP